MGGHRERCREGPETQKERTETQREGDRDPQRKQASARRDAQREKWVQPRHNKMA